MKKQFNDQPEYDESEKSEEVQTIIDRMPTYWVNMRDTYSPKETEKYCTQIDYPDEVKGLFFIQHRLLYFVPSTEVRKEVVLSMNPKGEKGHGRVKVVVEKDGTVSFPCVMERNMYHFDEKVLPVISRMPKWVPALINGEPVRAFHDIEVEF